MLEENVRVEFGQQGLNVDNAIWNMHLIEENHFSDILVSVVVAHGQRWRLSKLS